MIFRPTQMSITIFTANLRCRSPGSSHRATKCSAHKDSRTQGNELARALSCSGAAGQSAVLSPNSVSFIMLEELERHNYAPSIIRAYIRTIEHFARDFHCYSVTRTSR